MACGDSKPQQSTGTQYSDSNPPPMSMANGQPQGLAPQQSVYSNVNPAPMSIAPQQMAQQAAAMPTANANLNPTNVTDGIMPDGTYNPKFDTTINQIAGRMKAMQDSGAFLTPQQRAMQQHPILMGLANGLKTFGQGLTHQPFMTSSQESESGLENTQSQNAAQLMSPTNMMNMMFMKSMMPNGGVPQGQGDMSGNKGNPLSAVAPHLVQPGAQMVINGVPMTRDASGNWNPQGQK